MEKADSLIDLIENSIKQTICFEIIKKDSDIKNLSKEDLLEIHKKAEILASKIDHKDLNYQNRYTFENMKKEVYENMHDLPQKRQLNEREISKLTEIIQNERTLELQKQHDLQLQQSLQKSRGCEIEI